MNRRGVTLLEVLIAIFCMAIGLLALLVLFPLGALNMAQAIKDDRTAHAAANADAAARATGLRVDASITGAFTNPGGGLPAITNPNGPGYPVYVDPVGYVSWGPIGGTYGIPRRVPSVVVTAGQVNPLLSSRWFTLLDDYEFDDNGLPVNNGGELERHERYTWAYLLRCPRAGVTSVVDMTIVVYGDRSSVIQGESTYTGVTISTTSNVISLPATLPRPNLKKGGWILDATMLDGTGTVPDPHGFFYRVVNIVDRGDGGVDIELETNPRLPSAAGVIVVPDNVAEVFEKGPSRVR